MIENKQEEKLQANKIIKSRNLTKVIVSSSFIVLVLIIGYFGYGYYLSEKTKTTNEKTEIISPRVLQLDVLNGCGVKGIGSKFTDFFRTQGFDVVESKNYKSFQVSQTLVIDRTGDLAAARRVAAALGVKEKNIIQQINLDYFVDVSVIIGKDYSQLNPTH
jgi:hypothetical protein